MDLYKRGKYSTKAQKVCLSLRKMLRPSHVKKYFWRADTDLGKESQIEDSFMH